MRDDLENHRRALTWLLEHGRVHEACDIAWGLLFFWFIRGHSAEGLRWYEQILDNPSLSPADESRALVGACLMLYAQGNVARPRAMLTRAILLADQSGDRVVSAQAQVLFGHVEHGSGNTVAALERFGRGLEAFRSLDNPWGTGSALSGTAGVRLSMGDTSEAERLLHEATSVLREAGPWFLDARAVLPGGGRGQPRRGAPGDRPDEGKPRLHPGAQRPGSPSCMRCCRSRLERC